MLTGGIAQLIKCSLDNLSPDDDNLPKEEEKGEMEGEVEVNKEEVVDSGKRARASRGGVPWGMPKATSTSRKVPRLGLDTTSQALRLRGRATAKGSRRAKLEPMKPMKLVMRMVMRPEDMIFEVKKKEIYSSDWKKSDLAYQMITR